MQCCTTGTKRWEGILPLLGILVYIPLVYSALLTKLYRGVAAMSNSANQCQWLIAGLPCGQHFTTFDNLIAHLGREHDVQGPAGRKLVCQWGTYRGSCGNQYRRDAYRRHVATHLNHSFSCTVKDCNKSYSRADTLRSHMKKTHTSGLPPPDC